MMCGRAVGFSETDSVNTFKAHLERFLLHKEVMLDFVVGLSGTGNFIYFFQKNFRLSSEQYCTTNREQLCAVLNC